MQDNSCKPSPSDCQLHPRTCSDDLPYRCLDGMCASGESQCSDPDKEEEFNNADDDDVFDASGKKFKIFFGVGVVRWDGGGCGGVEEGVGRWRGGEGGGLELLKILDLA